MLKYPYEEKCDSTMFSRLCRFLFFSPNLNLRLRPNCKIQRNEIYPPNPINCVWP